MKTITQKINVPTGDEVLICDFRDGVDANRPYDPDKDWVDFENRDAVPKKYPQGVGLSKPNFYLNIWPDSDPDDNGELEVQLEDRLKSFYESFKPQRQSAPSRS